MCKKFSSKGEAIVQFMFLPSHILSSGRPECFNLHLGQTLPFSLLGTSNIWFYKMFEFYHLTFNIFSVPWVLTEKLTDHISFLGFGVFPIYFSHLFIACVFK